jgi:hypothetical protein
LGFPAKLGWMRTSLSLVDATTLTCALIHFAFPFYQTSAHAARSRKVPGRLPQHVNPLRAAVQRPWYA